MSNKPNRRPDHTAGHRAAFEKNRKRILASQNLCAICGRPVDKKLPPSDDWAPTVDHIIPISRGGHPSDISNLQLAHNICNRNKSNKVLQGIRPKPEEKKYDIPDWAFLGRPIAREAAEHGLPWSCDWYMFGCEDEDELKE